MDTGFTNRLQRVPLRLALRFLRLLRLRNPAEPARTMTPVVQSRQMPRQNPSVAHAQHAPQCLKEKLREAQQVGKFVNLTRALPANKPEPYQRTENLTPLTCFTF